MHHLKSFLLLAMLTTSTLASAAPQPSSSPAASEAASPSGIQIVVQSRSESSARTTIAYTIAERAFKLTATHGSTSTLEVTEGGRTMLKVVINPDGGGQLTNHRGRTYTLSQLKADPALQQQFDVFALAAINIDVASFLAFGGPVPNPCVPPYLAIACAVGSYIALCCVWGASGDGWGIECDCPGV